MKYLVIAALTCALLGCQQAGRQGRGDYSATFAQCNDLPSCDQLVATSGQGDVERANAYASRARVLANLGRTDDALKDADAATKLDPGNQALMLFKISLAGSMESGAGCTDGADTVSRLKACDAWVARESNSPKQADALDARAAALADAGRFADALADLDRADRLRPQRQDAELHRALVLTLAGDYPKALAVARKAVADSIFDDAHLLDVEGELLYLTGEREQAVKAFDASYKADDQAVRAKFWSAIIRLELKQEAAGYLRALLGHPMMSPLGAAIIRFRLREGDEANVLNEAKMSGPDAPCIAYFNIGHDAWIRGDRSGARAAFQQAVDTGRTALPEYRAAKLILQKL